MSVPHRSEMMPRTSSMARQPYTASQMMQQPLPPHPTMMSPYTRSPFPGSTDFSMRSMSQVPGTRCNTMHHTRNPLTKSHFDAPRMSPSSLPPYTQSHFLDPADFQHPLMSIPNTASNSYGFPDSELGPHPMTRSQFNSGGRYGGVASTRTQFPQPVFPSRY